MANPDSSRLARIRGRFADWNDRMVERYDIERYYAESSWPVRWIEQQRIRALARLARVQPLQRLLEVGCGAGHVMQQFPQSSRIGLDLSARMLPRARGRLGAQVPLVRAAAEQLPFAAATFDVVLCTEVLEHVLDPATVVCELLRVTIPEGRIVISIPNEENIDRIKRTLRRTPILRRLLKTLAEEGNEWHLHRFDWSLFERIVNGNARISKRIAVPSALLPIRYVAVLEPVGS
jgi:ubiquinone/menaquinone biosynthesis C-methylase UbiE